LGAALASLVLGVLVAKNGSDILLPIFMGTAAVAMLCMSLMPPVGASPYVKKKAVRASSYGEMLRSNKALVLFLISVVVLGIGQAPVWTFINRLIESLGGSAKEQGVVIMIQSGMELPAMFMSGLLLRRFRPHQLVRFSFASYALKSLLFLLSGSTGMLYAAAMLGFSCFGFYGFAGVMYANEIVSEPDQKVRAQSLISLAFSGGIGGVLGNAAGGVILDSFGLRALLIFSVVLSALSLLFMSLSVRALKDAEGRAR
jgi:PPP family 3-phenylpropionic acid transporter